LEQFRMEQLWTSFIRKSTWHFYHKQNTHDNQIVPYVPGVTGRTQGSHSNGACISQENGQLQIPNILFSTEQCTREHSRWCVYSQLTACSGCCKKLVKFQQPIKKLIFNLCFLSKY
jgi:hypothetical protein